MAWSIQVLYYICFDLTGKKLLSPPVSGYPHAGVFIWKEKLSDRAIVFIDGNNFYHSLKDKRVSNIWDLSYSKISLKLLGPRDWIGTRYYIGRVQREKKTLYSNQRRFFSKICAEDNRITTYTGRLEPRPFNNPASKAIMEYLNNLTVRIDKNVYQDLLSIARKHNRSEVLIEKAVDVMLAVDMVIMAERDEYDAAYLITADGDFTPAVNAVRSLSKKVYAASLNNCWQLKKACNTFLLLKPEWFTDCY